MALVSDDAPVDKTCVARRVPSGRSVPWAELLKWAVIGTLVMLALIGIDYKRSGGSNPLSFLQPGSEAVSARLIHQDFPTAELPSGEGLDGQEHYAIARDPLHLDETSHNLDRPQYRLQHPLLGWMGWALHPTGGGNALVLALAAVVLAGVVLGALAVGYLSWTWGGPVWVAVLFPLLPGSWWSQRTIASDALAIALAVAAIALAEKRHLRWAMVLAVLAVLAKEPIILVLGGWWLARRTRRDLAVVVIPVAVAAAWWLWLHTQLPADPFPTRDLDLPFVGLTQAWSGYWSHGHEWASMACMLAGLAVAALALGLRGLRHRLGWAIAVQTVFLLCMGVNPTAMNFGGTRMAMPVAVLSILALATPDAVGSRIGRAHAAGTPKPAPGS